MNIIDREIALLRSIVRSCRDHIARGTPLNWTGDELTAMRRAEDERQPDKSGLRK